MSTQQGDSGLPHGPATGRSDWAVLLGKFPFVGEGGCLSLHMCVCNCVRFCVVGAWRRSIFIWPAVQPGASSGTRNRRWHTLAGARPCPCAHNLWVPVSQRKLGCCLHTHFRQPDNHLYSYSAQAWKARSGPASPLCACLSLHGIISQKSLRFHPQVHPETATAQWYYMTIVAILWFARPLKRILLPQRAKAVLTHPAL